ncbi:hypothetical protein MTO96_014992 [Rhipicephalus appendiculatus]
MSSAVHAGNKRIRGVVTCKPAAILRKQQPPQEMRPFRPISGGRSLGAADLYGPGPVMPNSRSGAATPSAPRPRNIWEKVRAAVATPGPIIADKGAPRSRWRPQEQTTPSPDSSEIHIDEDLTSRMAAAFNLPNSKRFGRRQWNTAKELERRQPAPELSVRSPRSQHGKTDVGRAQKEPEQEKAKPWASMPPVYNKTDYAKPTVTIPALTKTAEKATPKQTSSRRRPLWHIRRMSSPTAKATVATGNASAKTKATTPTVQKPGAKVAAAQRTPLNRIQPESSLEQESGYPSELDGWVKGDGARQDHPLFARPAVATVLDKAAAYAGPAQYVWPQHQTTAAAPYPVPPPPATIGIASTEPGSVNPYYSGVASNEPTAVIYAEAGEDDGRYAEEMDMMWMMDTDLLPMPPAEDDSIDRRMTITLLVTAALVAMMTLTLMCVALISMFLKAAADNEVATSAPTKNSVL